ncbi:MAG TPA: coenzyme F420-0:L-glutamate ligase [Candidatus Paceibacterota bacterium]|nr:coenzyme F420-0:L-glutamate ligase [Candidatus Paceibacterota bacterium]
MEIVAFKLKKLVPPKDDLLAALFASKLKLKDGDVLAISSKVVSIAEGRCVSANKTTKEKLIQQEAELVFAPKKLHKWGYKFTVTNGALVGSAGIDQSNGNGYFILWPKDPMRSAKQLRAKIMKHYGVNKLGIVITDSTSRPMRRGASGFALAWAGFNPLYDYRGSPDIFGRIIQVEQANIADSLAAAAVLSMGEGSEQTPVALMRDVPKSVWNAKPVPKGETPYIVSLKDDLFAPFLQSVKWKKGKKKRPPPK